MNPRAYVKDEAFVPPDSAQDITVEWEMRRDGEPEEAIIFIRGVEMARVAPGEQPGRSRLAKKDNPIAKVLVKREVTE